MRVVVTDVREAPAAHAARYLASLGYDVVANDPDSGVCLWDEAAVARWAGELGAVGGVIHPAPRARMVSFADATEDEWRAAREEGPIAAWAVTKAFCGAMADAGGGSMIYLGSIHADKPVGGGFLFSAGCGATQMLCREAGQVYAKRGVRCFYVKRGPIAGETDKRTDVSGVYWGTDSRYPQRETPNADYLSGLLAFLLTPASWPLNGGDVPADGGMTMYYGHHEKEAGVTYP